MKQQSKTALVLGASGLVGSHLLSQLLEHPAYARVVSLGRRNLDIQHPKLTQHIFDFDEPEPALMQGDDLFCALGTTLRKAGTKEVQYRIDCQYLTEAGRMALQNGVQQYLLVSSLGADASSKNFYLKTKGDLEENIRNLQFTHFVSARPSILLGDRSEFRLGEKIGIWLATALSPLIPKRYRGIHAGKVAHALIHYANNGTEGVEFVESETLQSF